MNTLGISTKERAISRIVFYLCVTFTMWLLNHITPQSASSSFVEYEQLDFATPLIAVPVSELSFVPVSR